MPTHISIPSDVTVVVLDLDGTIYRMPRMGWHMFRKNRFHLPSLIAERRWRKAWRKALSDGTKVPKKPVSEKWYTEKYLPGMVQIIADHYEQVPWLQPLLDECKQRKIKVVVLSDYEFATDKLKALHLSPSAFDLILSTGDLGMIKPDPRLGDVLAKHLMADTNNAAINWQHVLFIGDREDTEGKLASALGAQFVKV